MFAWEARVEAQMASRREVELSYIRRFKFLELAINVVKCVQTCSENTDSSTRVL